MTVSANPTPDFQRDQILTAAIRKCGLLTAGEAATPEQIADASVHFNLALQDLQSEGVVLRSIERATLALVSGQAEYTLPTDVIDVELGQDDAIGTIISSDGTTETILKTMSRGEWMNIAQKSTTTLPGALSTWASKSCCETASTRSSSGACRAAGTGATGAGEAGGVPPPVTVYRGTGPSARPPMRLRRPRRRSA